MISEYIKQYLQKDIYPLHMPGHKRRDDFFPALIDLDMTEIPGMDNLHAPEGLILEAQNRIAEIYQSEKSYLLVNGATGGIISAIAAVCGEHEKVLSARNAHRSLFSGLLFSGAKPIFFNSEITPFGFFGGVPPATIERCLQLHGDCKAVYVTSPTYEGFVSDIKAIADIVHKRNKILVVDEAHGAHFCFHNIFPKNALAQGADIVINSAHKTLPTLTQSALLHVQGGRVDTDKLEFYLAGIQTGSPSYILMATMEKVIRLLFEDKSYFEKYAALLSETRESMSRNTKIKLVGDEIIGTFGIHDLDLGKLLFITPASLTGKQLEKTLSDRYGVQLEMSGCNFALAMTSVADERYGLERLTHGITAISRTIGSINHAPRCVSAPPSVESVYTPREAAALPRETVPLQESAGRISAELIAAYPPGIPILAPGERITKEALDYLHFCGVDRANIKVIR